MALRKWSSADINNPKKQIKELSDKLTHIQYNLESDLFDSNQQQEESTTKLQILKIGWRNRRNRLDKRAENYATNYGCRRVIEIQKISTMQSSKIFQKFSQNSDMTYWQ